MEDWKAHGGPVESGAPPARRSASGPASRPQRAAGGLLLRAIDASSFGALFRLWLLLVAGFGAAYWAVGFGMGRGLIEHGAPVGPDLHGLVTAIYFSFVTATSVGFGDVVPVGPLRVLAIAESAAGLLLFGCIISKLVSRRQEELTAEIHRITFEDRLGRVQTNLHLVFSELQSIASECAERGCPLERLLPRVESTAMVFTGELRAIHDLLYRPQQAPEEAALEAILAGLAAGLRELRDLLAGAPAARAHSPLLASSLASIHRLAGEICGECVPREHAPALRVWMDRIQELAGGLAG